MVYREAVDLALKTDKSRKLQKRAEQLIPGGVNSPVRAFRAVGADPRFIVRGSGSRIWDADGNEYIDYVGSWGPLILGHAPPGVVEGISAAARNGTSFGASTSSEADLAEIVMSAFPHIEKIRFVSSGTEATMSAIRLARAYTKRKYIVKFEGCYHGHADALLVKAGSGVATLGIPGSAGVPEEFIQFTLALPFNDHDALEHAFTKFKRQIACVIVEPVVGNMGCVPPERGYLDELREGIAAAANDAGVPICYNRVGSMFTWFFTAGPVTNWDSAARSDTEAFGSFFRSMLDNGIYLPPSQFEAAFLSAAHTAEDVQQTIAAAKQAFAISAPLHSK